MIARGPAGAGALLAFALVGLGGCRPDGGGSQEQPSSVGPRIEAVDLDGLVHALPVAGARITVVNCWATWCAPCVGELPDLLAAVKPWREKGVRLVLVSQDLVIPSSGYDRVSGIPMLRRFLEARHLECDARDLVLLYDDSPARLAERFELQGPIPVTFLVDASGKVVARHEGEATRAEFEALISSVTR